MAQRAPSPVTQAVGSSQSPISHLRMTGVRVPRASSSPGSGRLFADGHCALRAFLSSLSLQLQQMKEKKGLYPDKSVYTQQIGPGLCFGALALMLRFFFEVPGGGGRTCRKAHSIGPRPPGQCPLPSPTPLPSLPAWSCRMQGASMCDKVHSTERAWGWSPNLEEGVRRLDRSMEKGKEWERGERRKGGSEGGASASLSEGQWMTQTFSDFGVWWQERPWGLDHEGRPLGGRHLARLPGHGRGLGRSPWKWQVPGSQQRHRERAGEWGLEEEMGCRDEEPRPDTHAPSTPAGLGSHLRAQFLPLRPGHVLRPAAAQGEQEGWRRRAPGQAGLRHPVLCLCLTLHPYPLQVLPAPSYAW